MIDFCFFHHYNISESKQGTEPEIRERGESVVEFNVVKLLILAAWIFSAGYALKQLNRRCGQGESDFLLKYLDWADVAAVLAPPLVLLAVQFEKQLTAFLLGVRAQAQKHFSCDITLYDAHGEPVVVADDVEASRANRMVRQLLYDAQKLGTSDIFIDPKPDGHYSVRYRVDGSLRLVKELEGPIGRNALSAIKVVAGMDITESRRPQDGNFSSDGELGPVSYRVAMVGAYGGEKATIRLLGSSSGPVTLQETGLQGESLQMLKSAVRVPSGLILICGPTGSGKTTTLYALLKMIDYSLKNVISIEDPIEHVVPEISQMEVNVKAEITFAKLLRNALRQNPDIICLGEIRDSETAEIAAHAAQTGHLIIATLHCNDNLGAIDRLMDLGIAPRSLAAILQLIVSQRLVRKLCHCKKPAQLPEQYAEFFTANDLDIRHVCAPSGCPDCGNTGYSQRIALFDVMTVTNQLRMLFEDENPSLAAIKDEMEKEHGSSLMRFEGFKLVAQGLTSLDEVERVTMNLG